jgi:Lon protease-like protein
VDLEPLNLATLSHLPVFPLPRAVLFPGTVLPLHVFEPRYVDMVTDALAGDRTLAIVMLKDEAAEAESAAPIHDVACAGRIIHADRLDNGRYNILLQGMHRVRLLEELPLERAYRRFRAEIIPRPSEAELVRASRELGRMQSCVLSLRSSVAESDEQLVEVLRSTPDPVQLADILSAAVVSDSALQQSLLAEADFQSRLKSLIDALADVMVRTGAPPREAQMN